VADITAAREALVTRILGDDARASRERRKAAFDNAGLQEPLRTLVDKVARRATTVTDEDISAVRAAGVTEDQIFEIVVCGAVGQAVRQHDQALAALDAGVREA
jgi:alkylhydroperoxidase family enzyme